MSKDALSRRLDSTHINEERMNRQNAIDLAEERAIDDRRLHEILAVLSNLSNSIKDLAAATAAQRPPVVLNVIASNDDDLQKFATIFAQEIK